MKKVRLSFAAKITLISTLIWGIWILVTNRLIGAFNSVPLQLRHGHLDQRWLFVHASAVLFFSPLHAEVGNSQLSVTRNLRKRRIVAVTNLVDEER
jgi:hypothetical protein